MQQPTTIDVASRAPLSKPSGYSPSAAEVRGPNDEFLLKEYELLRLSIENELAELRKLDRWVLIATAAFWTWVFLDPASRTGRLIMSVPVLVVLIFWAKTVAITKVMNLTSQYLCEYPEGILAGQRGDGAQLGYERFFHAERCRNPGRFSTIQQWSIVYYAILLLANLALVVTGGAGMLPADRANARSGSVTIQVD